MRKILVSIVMALGLVPTAFAADPGKTEMDPKMQEMMKKWKDAATPGAPHQMLADLAGEWAYTSKMWHSANAKPEESSGTSTMKMIMGGRWLQHDIKGQAMGMAYEGMGLTGYDNVKKKYQSLWFDTMGTGVTHGEGTFDSANKILKDKGQFSCPMTGKDRSYRSEWKIVDKNNTIFSMYGTGMDGKSKEFKEMEMTFKRVK